MTDATFEDLVKVGQPTSSSSLPESSIFEGLPHFLRHNSKITMDHEGAFHKGFLMYSQEGASVLKSAATLVPLRSTGQFSSRTSNRPGQLQSAKTSLSLAIRQLELSCALHLPIMPHRPTSYQLQSPQPLPVVSPISAPSFKPRQTGVVQLLQREERGA